MKVPGLALAGIAVMSWLEATPAFATSGYGVGQESVTGSGMANAGGAAAALDAGTVYSNPAGMSVLDHNEIMVGAIFALPTITYTERGSTIFDGSPLQGPANGHGGQLAFVPDIYWVSKVSDRVHVGLGINAPWGLVTEYDRPWIGRYNEITTSLRVANINPSVSYKIRFVQNERHLLNRGRFQRPVRQGEVESGD
jgi:long-chain fatty acid transport protein